LGIYQDQQDLPRQFYKEQCKDGEERAAKRRIARIISLSGKGLKFCDALRESENIIKWSERVAKSVVPQRSP